MAPLGTVPGEEQGQRPARAAHLPGGAGLDLWAAGALGSLMITSSRSGFKDQGSTRVTEGLEATGTA